MTITAIENAVEATCAVVGVPLAILGCYFGWRGNRRAARAHVRLDDAGTPDTPDRARRGRFYERLLYPFSEPHPGHDT